jgi:hypothetical protein
MITVPVCGLKTHTFSSKLPSPRGAMPLAVVAALTSNGASGIITAGWVCGRRARLTDSIFEREIVVGQNVTAGSR